MFVDIAEKKWENCVRGFMKKLLAILVLGLLLAGCKTFPSADRATGETWVQLKYAEWAVEHYKQGHKFFSVAYTYKKGEALFAAAHNFEEAKTTSIQSCNEHYKVNDCYVVKTWDVSALNNTDDVHNYVLLGLKPKKNIENKKRETDIISAKTKCKEMGFLETDDAFKHCVLKVVEIISDEKSTEKVELENKRQLLLLKEIRESQKRQRKREKHWQGIKQMDKILNKGSAF